MGGLRQAMASQGMGGGSRTVESFEYLVCSKASQLPAWDGWVETGEDSEAEPPEGPIGAEGRIADVNFEERLAQETRRSFEAGRERGHEEGRSTEREAQASAAAAESDRRRRQFAELIGTFSRERDCYLHNVEQEVVRLALAVAARILRREAQMDPLLLTGAVRVALGQLAATSEIRLRVPAREADLWKETIALLPSLATKPVIVAKEDMLLGDCAIESKVGTVDLGIRAQLSEIERGFFDRAGTPSAPESRPGDRAAQEGLPAEARS